MSSLEVPRSAKPHPALISVVVVLMLTLMLTTGGAPAWAAPPEPAPSTGGWPLDGTPTVEHTFDPPDVPWGAGNRGVDLQALPGQRVLAPADGRVVFVGKVGGKPVVVIDHGGARSTLEPVDASVRVGQEVHQGDVVGTVSATLGHDAHCGGHCLHWGLKRGKVYLDPLILVDPEGSAGSGGTLRLVPASQRAKVVAEAIAREVARKAAESTVAAAFLGGAPMGPAGSHGFLHPVPGAITSPFGRRFHPVLHVWKLHDGTDFGASCGTPIRAAYGGRVTRRVSSVGYGNRLFLDHGMVDGHHVVTAYNHAIRYVVSSGAHVRRGQVIGYVGSTGFATGCHLHLMIWLDGRMVNPMTWL